MMVKGAAVSVGIISMVVLVGIGLATWSPLAAAAPEPEGVVSGECAPTKIKFKTSDALKSTNSSSFVDVPDMKMSFTVSGTGATCLEVEFSAEVSTASGGPIMLVRAVLDSATVGHPGTIQFTASQPALFHAHAFHFAFVDVAPGAHTIRMQWATLFGDVYMGKRSLFTHYR